MEFQSFKKQSAAVRFPSECFEPLDYLFGRDHCSGFLFSALCLRGLSCDFVAEKILWARPVCSEPSRRAVLLRCYLSAMSLSVSLGGAPWPPWFKLSSYCQEYHRRRTPSNELFVNGYGESRKSLGARDQRPRVRRPGRVKFTAEAGILAGQAGPCPALRQMI